MTRCDIVIIGAGPAGYTAAIRASQLGGKVLLIEKDKPGGVCLNSGCIPTKSILASVSVFEQAKKAAAFGVRLENPSIDFKTVIERKDQIVSKLSKGVEYLIRKNKIEYIQGEAVFKDLENIEVSNKTTVSGKSAILAMGSSPALIKDLPIDGKTYFSSDQLLNFKEAIPEKLNIVGGGVIGIHFADIFSSLGTEVAIYESRPEILSGFDPDLIKFARALLARKNVTIHTGVRFDHSQNREKTLIAIGRAPNKPGIVIDQYMRTAQPNVFAAGDITGIKMLAHVASAQGIAAAENALGGNSTVNYNAIPAVIYTRPEIAAVGMTEEEAKEKTKIAVGRFPFSALGYSHAIGEIEGFIKVVAEKESGKILGVHIAGHQAGTLIGIASLAISNNFTNRQFTDVIYAHPSLPEALFEAGLNVSGRSINL